MATLGLTTPSHSQGKSRCSRPSSKAPRVPHRRGQRDPTARPNDNDDDVDEDEEDEVNFDWLASFPGSHTDRRSVRGRMNAPDPRAQPLAQTQSTCRKRRRTAAEPVHPPRQHH